MVKYSLDRDIVRPPETAFSYSNEDSMLLGEILENATGYLFKIMPIRNFLIF
jgi:CubicO group peptidase (beta-lactamase class C family)